MAPSQFIRLAIYVNIIVMIGEIAFWDEIGPTTEVQELRKNICMDNVNGISKSELFFSSMCLVVVVVVYVCMRP